MISNLASMTNLFCKVIRSLRKDLGCPAAAQGFPCNLRDNLQFMSMRESVHKAKDLTLIASALLAFTIAVPSMRAQSPNATPDWCRQLPRPEYKHLERVHTDDPRFDHRWFEIYRVAPG